MSDGSANAAPAKHTAALHGWGVPTHPPTHTSFRHQHDVYYVLEGWTHFFSFGYFSFFLFVFFFRVRLSPLLRFQNEQLIMVLLLRRRRCSLIIWRNNSNNNNSNTRVNRGPNVFRKFRLVRTTYPREEDFISLVPDASSETFANARNSVIPAAAVTVRYSPLEIQSEYLLMGHAPSVVNALSVLSSRRSTKQ